MLDHALFAFLVRIRRFKIGTHWYEEYLRVFGLYLGGNFKSLFAIYTYVCNQGMQYRTVPIFRGWLGTVWYRVPSGTSGRTEWF